MNQTQKEPNKNNEIFTSRFYSMLSLCKKAGKLVSGESKCENAIRAKNARIILLSNDASKNTKKKFVNSSIYYKVPLYTMQEGKDALGGAIGDGQRSVVVIIDDGFAAQMVALLKKMNG